VLELLVDGLALKEIAARLEVSFHTVNTHVRNIYDKLHVRSRGKAVAKALNERLLD
jgi:ATP/maltotriose-dependent transcriptional regulator MalT